MVTACVAVYTNCTANSDGEFFRSNSFLIQTTSFTMKNNGIYEIPELNYGSSLASDNLVSVELINAIETSETLGI